MNKHKLSADPREILGRKVKKLRQEKLVPANVFGKGVKSQAIQVSSEAFEEVYKEAGETGIIDLTVGKSTNPVLVSNVQVHPVTDKVLHVDFRQIDLTQKISATVSIEIVGESPAEKSGIGTVVQQISEVDVTALPADLPEKFEVDVTELTEVDAAIFVSDLKYDKTKVQIEADAEQIVVKVEPPQKEDVVEAPAEVAEGEEVPAEGEAQAPAEGETPAEEPAAE